MHAQVQDVHLMHQMALHVTLALHDALIHIHCLHELIRMCFGARQQDDDRV